MVDSEHIWMNKTSIVSMERFYRIQIVGLAASFVVAAAAVDAAGGECFCQVILSVSENHRPLLRLPVTDPNLYT